MAGRFSQAASVGELVRELREAYGYSHRQLANACDLSSTAVHQIEQHRIIPSPDIIERLRRGLMLSDREFLDMYRLAAAEHLVLEGWNPEVVMRDYFHNAFKGQTLAEHREHARERPLVEGSFDADPQT